MRDEDKLQEEDFNRMIGTCIGITQVQVKNRDQYGPQFSLTRNSVLFQENELPSAFINAADFIMTKDQISGHLQKGNLGSP